MGELVPEQPRVGVVGLGIMGSAMATHLVAAGFSVTGYDIVRDKVDALVRGGGSGATSPAELAGQADVVVTSLATAHRSLPLRLAQYRAASVRRTKMM